MTQVVQGILIPFLGTTLGAACALFLKNNLPTSVQRILTGFAAGIMTAASVWSLTGDGLHFYRQPLAFWLELRFCCCWIG